MLVIVTPRRKPENVRKMSRNLTKSEKIVQGI